MYEFIGYLIHVGYDPYHLILEKKDIQYHSSGSLPKNFYKIKCTVNVYTWAVHKLITSNSEPILVKCKLGEMGLINTIEHIKRDQ